MRRLRLALAAIGDQTIGTSTWLEAAVLRTRWALVPRNAGLLGVIALIGVLPEPGHTQSRPAGGPTDRGRPLAIEDYYRIKSVGSPELSPDGRWVAFTLTTRVEATNGEIAEVWLAPSDGSQSARRVSADGANASGPRWSSDGRLSFSSDSKRWRVDPSAPDRVEPNDSTGGFERRGRDNSGRVSLTSPRGNMVASVRDVQPPRREAVYASDFEKRHEERFKGVQFDWLDFQRDGQAFPVPNRVDPSIRPTQEIYLAPNDGGERQLTRLGLRPADVNWSPDRRRSVESPA